MKKFFLLTTFALSSCAAVDPVDISHFENIIEVSKEIAKSYTPGVMRLTTYAGMNASAYETENFASINYKVKGESDERENIIKTYQAYCGKFHGDFKSKDNTKFSSLTHLFCNKDKSSLYFSVMINSSNYNASKTLQCYSIMAVEDKRLGGLEFADQVLRLDNDNIKSGFYSNKGC